MKYFIVAGERSGDLHASNLLKALSEIDNDAHFVGFGGNEMQARGAEIKVHYKELAFMGFLEVLLNLSKIRGFIKQCKEEIKRFQPDAIILVDYGGFNMKIAKFGKSIGIPVHYYITPKVWAWNQKRAIKLKRYTDKMYVILPFEKAFFKKYHCEADYVGNPVLDAVKDYNPAGDNLPKDYIALLPGSRKQKLQHILPVMKKVAEVSPQLKFVVAQVDNLDPQLYEQIAGLNNVKLFSGHSYDLLASATAAIVTSGTATLETALWEIPQVVVYKTSRLSYKIAKYFIKVPFISLINLVAQKEVVKELIQGGFTAKNVCKELEALLCDNRYRDQMLEQYAALNEQLDKGSASANAANLIVNYLQKEKAKSNQYTTS